MIFFPPQNSTLKTADYCCVKQGPTNRNLVKQDGFHSKVPTWSASRKLGRA
jgi:hypothetical protein